MVTTGVPFVPGAPRAAHARLGAAGEQLREFEELAPLVADAAVTDVFVVAGRVWVDRGSGASPVGGSIAEPRARELAVRLVALGGRHVDEATPCVDVRLHDGIRVHVALPPVAVAGTQLSIRLPRVEALSLDDLEAAGAFALVGRGAVEALVADRVNVLVTGAGGSGKTTLLGAMLSAARPGERIVTIEDVAELRIRSPHVVSLQARQPNLEGAGEVTLERLVREALRMRPDRLVLGECRGAELRELLAALNTGHDGGAGTLHANALADVPARLEALGALAGLGPASIARQAVSALGAIVHVERTDRGRRIAAIGRLRLEGDRLGVAAMHGTAIVGDAVTASGAAAMGTATMSAAAMDAGPTGTAAMGAAATGDAVTMRDVVAIGDAPPAASQGETRPSGAVRLPPSRAGGDRARE